MNSENTVSFIHKIKKYQREWADNNGMLTNLHKTKEIVLHRPHPRRWSLPKSLYRTGAVSQITWSYISKYL